MLDGIRENSTSTTQPAQAQADNAGLLRDDALKATSPVFNWGERQPYIDLFNQQYIELMIQYYSPKTAASPLQVQATKPIKGNWFAHGFFDRLAAMGPTMIEFDLSTPGVLKLVAAGENASQTI